MENVIKDILLIQSLNLDKLIEDYRVFFLGIIPSMFVLAALFEYFDRMDTFALVKRAVVSILILTSVSSFYKSTIDASMEAANEKLLEQKQSNLLLMDMFSAVKTWDQMNAHKGEHDFYKENNAFYGTMNFLKYHLFDRFINDGFTVVVYFVCKICLVIIKVIYSLVYYLGFGLIGIPCLIYLFPTMGNVLRGGILSYLWCLVLPHVLVFILSMIGFEINKGYVSGQIIGGSALGTALLFVMSLFLAFTPLITAMILNGSGILQAGGIIATIGGNYVLNLPRKSLESAGTILTGGALGPKMILAKSALEVGAKAGFKAQGLFSRSFTGLKNSLMPSKVLEKSKSSEEVSKFAQGLISQYLENSKSTNSSGIFTNPVSARRSNQSLISNHETSSKPKFSIDRGGKYLNVMQPRNESRSLNQNMASRSIPAPLPSKTQAPSNPINRIHSKEVKREPISRPVLRNKKDPKSH